MINGDFIEGGFYHTVNCSCNEVEFSSNALDTFCLILDGCEGASVDRNILCFSTLIWSSGRIGHILLFLVVRILELDEHAFR